MSTTLRRILARQAHSPSRRRLAESTRLLWHDPAGLFNDTGPRYNAGASADAWQRLLDWFGPYLAAQ